MSSFTEIPSWLEAKSGEDISQSFLKWIGETKKKLLRAFPPAERAFCKTIDSLKHRLPRRWMTRLWYTRQKYFIVAPKVVFFGDFFFRNLNILVEIDGASHQGPSAQEKDEWRSKLITAWNVRTIRFTNSDVLNNDFRDTERWFIDQIRLGMPISVHERLLKDFDGMKIINKHLYDSTSYLTPYRHR